MGNRMRDAALKNFFERLPTAELRSGVAKAIHPDLKDIGLRAAGYAPHEDEPWLDRLWHRVKNLGSLPSQMYNKVVPPKALPSQLLPETDAPCASCGATAYAVRWTCACCVSPLWHVCGICVDNKGGGASCGGEGHWLFRVNGAPPAAKRAPAPDLPRGGWQCSRCTFHNTAKKRVCGGCG